MNLAYSKKKDLRILVLGYIIRGPMGGMTWHHLQYLLGLKELGFDVFYLEDSGDTPYCCYDPQRGTTDANPSYGLQYAFEVFDRFGFKNHWAYYNKHHQRWEGPMAGKVMEVVRGSDLVLNLSCSNILRPWFQDVPIRVLVDTDPVFTQIRNLIDAERWQLTNLHNAFFSFAENIGRPSCSIPDDGIKWMSTHQPVVLSAWPVGEGCPNGKFTTIMQWESYPSREYQGNRYGVKADSFGNYFELPTRTSSSFEIALGGPSAPRQKFKDHGWLLKDPIAVANDPLSYKQYIEHSKAEFSIAKQAYVVAKTGWFSERSTCYLATGRPVVVQDTGFSHLIESGKGILSFKTPEEASEAIDSVNKNYKEHCRVARILAEEYFNSAIVLNNLIDKSLELVRESIIKH